MSSVPESASSLNGELQTASFVGESLFETVIPAYLDLVEDHNVHNVLVLKRFPTGLDEFTDRLATEIDSIERPSVDSLWMHARSVLWEMEEPPTILSDAERTEVVDQFLQEYEWTTPYLDHASEQSSFRRDVGRLMSVATWQNDPLETDDEILREIGAVNEEFQAHLEAHGYTERGAVVSLATDVLRQDALRKQVQSEFSAVLALEFEEYTAVDRAYLSQLTTDLPLVCVAEGDSSIQRTYNEPGQIDDQVAGLASVRTDERDATTRPDAVAQYLATDTVAQEPADGTVQVISSASFEEQVRTVADEIQRLRNANGWSYDEFAIGFKDSSGPINDTIRFLHQAGIPTASATVPGFSDDPAVREILSLCHYLTDNDDRDRQRLAARIPELDDETFATLEDEDALANSIRRWTLETGLKRRIADQESALEARTQFANVQKAIELAELLDEFPGLEATWEEYTEALERAFESTVPETHTAAVDAKENGVMVDAIRVMKNASWKAVFLLNVVEGEYPSDPSLTSLLPEEYVEQSAAYPGVTTVSDEDVRRTFATESSATARPFIRYYTELSRRRLAIGARAATDRLYFGIYEQESGGVGRRVQPSRFLTQAYRQFPWIDSLDQNQIHGQSEAERFALTRVDSTLRSVRRAQHTETTVDLDSLETDLGAIQRLLADGGGRADKLRTALEARIDFAAGRVRNE